jgi:Ca-activated chloride channel homolog
MPPFFADPLWLGAGLLACVLVAALLVLSERQALRRLKVFAAPVLLQRLTGSHSRRRLWIKNSLLLLALLLLFASLARPQWGANFEKVESRGTDIMIALDTSRSMLAEDIAPNRLDRAKLGILDLLEAVRGDRVGLIAFAGSAFLQCPLTLDYQAFRQTLAALDTDTIPVGGTDIAAAIDEAEAYFEKTGNERILILITDGEDLEASGVQRARDAASKGTRILTVGVGSPAGELIPIRTAGGERDFLRDEAGRPVSTALDEATLRRIAAASEGVYVPLGATGRGLLEAYEFAIARSEGGQRQEMLQRIPIERYQWPLLLAIVLLVVEQLLTTRRRFPVAASGLPAALLMAMLGASLPSPAPAAASPATEAARAYKEGGFEESVELYRKALEADPDNPRLAYNLGVSAYRAGQFDTAIAHFERALRDSGSQLQTKAFFNTGNSRVAQGFEQLDDHPELTSEYWTAALSDYRNALGLTPGHDRAEHNLEALETAIANHTHSLLILAEPEEGGSASGATEAFHRVPAPISAEPSHGWQFTGWDGDGIEDPDKASTRIRLEQDSTVVARFVKTWRLEVLSGDPQMGAAGTSGTYREDEPVSIKAEPHDYFAFSKWIADGCELADPAQPETQVTLSGDATATATFVPAFKLSVMPDPEIGGTAGPSGFFEEYSVVPIQAEPRPGFEWVGWIGDGIKSPGDQQTTIALTADRLAIASMERVWNLVIIPVPEEGGSVDGAGNHPVGSTVEIHATPAEGHTFAGWEGPGVEDPSQPSTRVTVQSKDHTLFARFQQEDQESDQSDESDESDQSDQSDESDQSDQSDESDESDQSDESDESDQSDQSDQSDPSDPSDQSDPSDPSDPSDQSDQSDPPPTGEMTEEEARQLLNSLLENERFLPAGERSREPDSATRSGRNW